MKKEPLVLTQFPSKHQPNTWVSIMLKQCMSMKAQVTSRCRPSYFYLVKIASIRPSLSDESTAHLASSLILSRIYYCNYALSGLPSSSLNRLQKIQNNDVRLVLQKRKLDHIIHLLEKKTKKLKKNRRNKNKTTLAPGWSPCALQNWHTSFDALWEFSSKTASHLPTLSNSSTQQRKSVESPQN